MSSVSVETDIDVLVVPLAVRPALEAVYHAKRIPWLISDQKKQIGVTEEVKTVCI